MKRTPVMPFLAVLVLAGDVSAQEIGAESGNGSAAVVEVTQVNEGDVLQVLWDDRRRIVRLFGLDAPENGQRFYSRARELATALAAGERVQLIVVETNIDGEPMVRVTLPDGRELNQVLVRNGLAWWVEDSGASDLERLEKRARDEQRGLWSEAHPRPPWEYRQAQKAAEHSIIERSEEPVEVADDSNEYWAAQRREREAAQRREQARMQRVRDWYPKYQQGILPVQDRLNRLLEARARFEGMGDACRELNLAMIAFRRREELNNPPDVAIRSALSGALGQLGHMVRACQEGNDREMAEYYSGAVDAFGDLSDALAPFVSGE